MSTQKEIWRQEHAQPETFVRIHSDKPSGPIPGFVMFLVEQSLDPQRTVVLDVGCGKGRNSIYFADQGFNVVGSDFAPEALAEARARAGDRQNVEFREMDMVDPWPFENELDVVVDCNTTICIPNPGREEAVKSAYKALKFGGYYFFYGIAPTEFVRTNPGLEPNSGVFPRTGKFEKQYSRQELIETYKDFKLVKLEELSGSDLIEGKSTTYLMWVAVFQK